MIVYGWGEKKLKTDQLRLSQCPSCNEKKVSFHFFKKYFSLFWIPIFPFGGRKVAACEACGAGWEGKEIPNELVIDIAEAKARTKPSYVLFLGSVLIILAIVVISTLSDGMETYHYESGQKQAKGKMVGEDMAGEWTFWYENGNLAATQFYKNGKEDSIWHWYAEDGSLQKIGTYRNGLSHGKWTFYHPNGKVSEESYFHENRLEGLCRNYYENGQIAVEGSYSRGLEDGEYVYYYEDGTIYQKGIFEKAEETGLWISYFVDGSKSSEIEYSDGEMLVMNIWKEDKSQMVIDGFGNLEYYHTNGNLESTGGIRNGRRHGEWKTWHSSGVLLEVGHYSDNEYILDNSWDSTGTQMVQNGMGHHREYYFNGILQSEGDFNNGKAHNNWKYYADNGTLLSDLNYHEGKLDGESLLYTETGELRSKGLFKNDEKEGTWEWFFLSGVKECDVYFIDGKKDGIQTFWSETEKIVKTEHYEKGELIKEEKI